MICQSTLFIAKRHWDSGEPVCIECQSQGVAGTWIGIYPVLNIGPVTVYADPEQLTALRDTIDRWLATRPQIDAADAEAVDLSAPTPDVEALPETAEFPRLEMAGV